MAAERERTAAPGSARGLAHRLLGKLAWEALLRQDVSPPRGVRSAPTDGDSGQTSAAEHGGHGVGCFWGPLGMGAVLSDQRAVRLPVPPVG